MKSNVDKLLDMVDKWKFKLHDKLSAMSPQERAAYWKKSLERARAAGFRIAPVGKFKKRPSKPRRRAAG